jgi:uncharacterized protein (DUF433 family)
MATQTEGGDIVADEDVMGGEPRIAGRRITVRQIHERVEGRGLEPETVARRYDLDVDDVLLALEYYDDHPEEMAKIEQERDEAVRAARERGMPTLDDIRDE